MPIYLQDTFTDADGTALTAHTMDVGPGWTAAVGTFKIASNKATPNSNADDDQTVSDGGHADFVYAVDVVPFASGGNESDPDLIFRASDSTHLWVLHNSAAGGGVQQLYKNIGAGYVLVTSVVFAFASLTQYTIKVVAIGSLIRTYVNNVLQITATDSFNSTATKIGLRTGRAGTPGTLATWDNLLVVDALPQRIVQVNQSVMNSVSY